MSSTSSEDSSLLETSLTPEQHIGCLLAKLNETVDDTNLLVIKVILRHAVGISQQELDRAKQLSNVFELIEKYCPPLKSALQLLLYILKRLKVHSVLINELDSCVDELPQDKRITEDSDDQHNGIPYHYKKYSDFIVIVFCILCNLPIKKYESLQEIARRYYFTTYHSSKIDSRTCLLSMLLNRNAISPDDFAVLFAWLEVVDCQGQQALLRKYCRHYKIVEPEWRSLVPEVKEKCLKVSNVDNYSQSYPSSQECSEQFSSSLPQTRRDEVHFLHSSPAGSTPQLGRQFDFAGLDEYSIGATPQQLTSNSSQGSDDLVIPKPRAKVPGILVPGGLQVRRDGGAANGTDTPQLVEKDGDLEYSSEDGSSPVLCYPSQAVEDELASKPNHHMKIIQKQIEEGENVDITQNRHSLIRENERNTENTVKILIRKLQRWKCMLIIILIVLIFCIITVTSGGVGIGILIGKPPPNDNVTVGGNTTILMGKFNPTQVSSLSITSTSSLTDTEIKLHQSNLLPYINDTTLPSHTSPINETAGGNNIELNYNPENPIYTAGRGTLMYFIQFRFILEYFSNLCPVIYLFDSQYYYDIFIGQDYSDPVQGSIYNHSLCVNEADLRAGFFNQPLNLTLPHSGWFYVGISVPEGASVGVTIVPILAIYNIPSDSFQSCSLNWNNKLCHFSISHSKVPSSSHPVSLLASSTDTRVWNLTVNYDRDLVLNLGSVLSLGVLCSGTVVLLILIIIAFAVIAMCYCCYRRKRHRRRSDYEQLN